MDTVLREKHNVDLNCKKTKNKSVSVYISKILLFRGLRHELRGNEHGIYGKKETLHTLTTLKSSNKRRGINYPEAALKLPNTTLRLDQKKHTIKYKQQLKTI